MICVSVCQLFSHSVAHYSYNSNLKSHFCKTDNHIPTCFLSLFEPFLHLDNFLIGTL